MKNNNREDKNEFTFCGTIVNKYAHGSVLILTLGITTQGAYNRHSNYPRICFFGNDMIKKADKFGLHDKVVVTGYVTSSKKKNNETEKDKTLPPQSFVASDITPATSLLNKDLEVETKGGKTSLIPDENTIEIVGTVNKAYAGRGGNITLEIISFHDERYMKRIKVSVFPHKDENPMEYMVPGRRVAVQGYVRTARREGHDNKLRYFENIMATDIQKA